jgi:ketosteroid isomerase-like protein
MCRKSLEAGKQIMRAIAMLAVLALATSPAFADDRALITAQMQEMSDAVAPGNVAVWDKYLDPNVVYAEEDDSYKGKTDMLKEIEPLPKGLGGEIKVDLLSYHEDGDVAVALFRQNETEYYFGQTIYAKYLTNTTWRKRDDCWKLIAAQVLAEKTDPPAIVLSASQLAQYVGTYKLKDSEPTYTLTLDNGKLIGTRNGRKPATWNAEVPDVFFIIGDPRIRKIIQRDASDKVTGFIERRESWDVVWVKAG